VILAALALGAAGHAFTCRVVSVHDGDTMRCADGTRIRLQGIDANELDGTCHHACARGAADQARRGLEALVLRKSTKCTSTGTSYRRVTAWCTVMVDDGRPVDLSCEQVARGLAVIWRRFDPGHLLDRCGAMPPPGVPVK